MAQPAICTTQSLISQSYLSLASPPTGKSVYKNAPPSFSPDGYDSLVAWYDSNSANIQQIGSSNILTSWRDKTPYQNTIYPQPQVYPAYPVGSVITGLSNCEGVSIDSIGNVYLAEGGNVVIKMFPQTTGTYFGQYMLAGGNSNYIIAGTYSQPGFSGDGGPATNAKLNYPRYASIDCNGNLFIADAGQNSTGITGSRIRMVPAKSGSYFSSNMTSCNIYTIGGDGTQSSAGNGGPLSNAKFDTIYNIIVDSNNNLYIADLYSIRMVPVKNSCNWGINMTSNYVYGIVNWSNGTTGIPSNGTLGSNASTQGAIRGITIDSIGNLFYNDSAGNVTMMMPKISGNYYGQNMNSNCVYQIAGGGDGGTVAPFNCSALAANIHFNTALQIAFNDVLVITNVGAYNGSYNTIESGLSVIPRTNTVLYGKQLQSNYIYEVVGSNGYLTQQNFVSAVGGLIDSKTSNIFICDYGYYSQSFLYTMKVVYPTSVILNNFDFFNITCTNQQTLEFKYPNCTNYPNSGITIFTVWKPALSQFTDINLTQNIVSIFVDNMVTPGDFGANFSVGVVGGVNLKNFYIGTSDLSTNSNNTYKTLSLADYTQKPHIINAICFNSNYLGTGNYSRGYIDGACVSSNTTPITLTNNQNFFNVYLGDVAAYINCNTGGHGGSSFIIETLVYNTVLTTAQISLVNQYLVAKNGAAALANGGVFSY